MVLRERIKICFLSFQFFSFFFFLSSFFSGQFERFNGEGSDLPDILFGSDRTCSYKWWAFSPVCAVVQSACHFCLISETSPVKTKTRKETLVCVGCEKSFVLWQNSGVARCGTKWGRKVLTQCEKNSSGLRSLAFCVAPENKGTNPGFCQTQTQSTPGFWRLDPHRGQLLNFDKNWSCPQSHCRRDQATQNPAYCCKFSPSLQKYPWFGQKKSFLRAKTEKQETNFRNLEAVECFFPSGEAHMKAVSAARYCLLGSRKLAVFFAAFCFTVGVVVKDKFKLKTKTFPKLEKAKQFCNTLQINLSRCFDRQEAK